MDTTDQKKAYQTFQKLEDLYVELSKATLEDSKAVVTSAVELNQTQKKTIATLLAKRSQELEISYVIDERVIGGIKVACGDWLFDATTSTSLKNMATVIKEKQS